MAKLACTYYTNLFEYPHIFHFKVHKSGKEAVRYLRNHAESYFQAGINWKKKDLKLRLGNQVTAGLGFRGMVARYLDEDEIILWKHYGNDCSIDIYSHRLGAPIEEEDGNG